MIDKKVSILDEPIMGIKVKYWLSALMFIAGVALVIIAVVTGVVDGFEGNYIKLIVGLFLMAYLIELIIVFSYKDSKRFKHQRYLQKEAERIFDTPEKILSDPHAKKNNGMELLTAIMVFFSIFLFLISIGACIASSFLDLEHYTVEIAQFGVVGDIVSIVLFFLSWKLGIDYL